MFLNNLKTGYNFTNDWRWEIKYKITDHVMKKRSNLFLYKEMIQGYSSS